MPKQGYGAITIPLTLKEQLTTIAEASNLSVPKLIEQLINDLRSSGVGLRGFKSRPPHSNLRLILSLFQQKRAELRYYEWGLEFEHRTHAYENVPTSNIFEPPFNRGQISK